MTTNLQAWVRIPAWTVACSPPSCLSFLSGWSIYGHLGRANCADPYVTLALGRVTIQEGNGDEHRRHAHVPTFTLACTCALCTLAASGGGGVLTRGGTTQQMQPPSASAVPGIIVTISTNTTTRPEVPTLAAAVPPVFSAAW